MFLTAAIFVTIWFVTIYPLLHLGVEAEDKPVPGQPLGAPKASRFGWKLLLNTLIAAILTAAIVYWYRQGGVQQLLEVR